MGHRRADVRGGLGTVFWHLRRFKPGAVACSVHRPHQKAGLEQLGEEPEWVAVKSLVFAPDRHV